MPDDATGPPSPTDDTKIEIVRSDVENLLSRFHVRLIEGVDSVAEYDVTVSRVDWERFGAGFRTPEALVEATMRFLLEREPKEQILATFDLGQIPRFFPSYARDITPSS